MSTVSNVVRPLGMLEKLYPARQLLNVYNSVIVTATYAVPLELEDTFLYASVRAAIPGLLHRHLPLSCYIAAYDTARPSFGRLETVEARDVLDYVRLEQGDDLAGKLQELHDQQWPVEPKPLWKLVVMRELQTMHGSSADAALHIAFVYHHVIGDGLSGNALHHSLLHELENLEQKSQASQDTSDVISTPPVTTLVEPIERLISLPLSWIFLMKQAVKEYAPQWLIGVPSTIWAGLPNKTLDELPFRTRVRLVTIRPEDSQFLVEASREHDVSLTSLITAAVASALANEVPTASKMLGLTPYTLRRVTGTSMAEMVNQSTGFETIYPADILDRLRKVSNTIERRDSLWATASYFHTQLQSELAKCPKDNLVGLLPYVIDHVDFYKKKFGKAREATWELSNLGVFKPLPGTSSNTWKLNSMTFTQGAQPLGSALTVNGVSVQDKPLTLAITWQDRVIDERIIDAVAHGFADLSHLLRHNDSTEAADTELRA
ncbi:MAG: hypothetical protein Q9226_004845 [Calogaya cf. arnoldii]